MTEEEREKLEQEFERLYDLILSDDLGWDEYTLDRLLAVHLKLNKEQYGDIAYKETVPGCLQAGSPL